MKKSVMVSRNSDEGDAASMPTGRGPMAHRFDSVCRNQPTPQIMIQLIGCRIETARTHEGRKEELTNAASHSNADRLQDAALR
jgi:hypothetical protein